MKKSKKRMGKLRKISCQKGHEIRFSEDVLNYFRENVGIYSPETGGMLASKAKVDLIDAAYFDVFSNNTSGSFYYDVDSMTKVFHSWKEKGYTVNGIFHSHPSGCVRPSYHDVSTALLHIRFFGLNYFYMPIIQSSRKGYYTMYVYVVKLHKRSVSVDLNCIVKASDGGFEYSYDEKWKKRYVIDELDSYREGIGGGENKTEIDDKYFSKNIELFSKKALERKVIVCVGTGGARSFLENLARNGFRYFVLIDADVVSPSNIATQGVFISEMGKKKVEVIRDRILDINPHADIVCVDKFLDDNMTDEEFKSYMDRFESREKTDYLILGCTDNFYAQKRSAVLSLKYGTSYMAAMLYKNGLGAEIIFTYPGVTRSCPRCLLSTRYEKYEDGFENDVDSSSCSIFATESMNALKGYVALMLLNYKVEEGYPMNDMLDRVKDRNFIQIRLSPDLGEKLGIELFDKLHEEIHEYSFMNDTAWIPQVPDHPTNGYKACELCGGEGNLEDLFMKWKDTRLV